MGSSGSSATTVTDANGHFSMTFVPGTTYFAGFRGQNNSALTLAGTEDFPFFIRRNFPEPGYDANKPIYIGKTVDTLIIKVYTFKKVTTSDTFGLKGNTINARFDKKYTGITADSADTFTLDTIYNALFTDFDCIKKTFGTDLQFGRLKTYPGYTNQSFSAQSLYGLELSAEDETRTEMKFYFTN